MKGQPILKLEPRNKLNHGITTSAHYEEWEACIAAGLDIEKWEYGGYSTRFKAHAIAWHRLHNAVDMMLSDAAIEKQKSDIKKAKKKGSKKGKK